MTMVEVEGAGKLFVVINEEDQVELRTAKV